MAISRFKGRRSEPLMPAMPTICRPLGVKAGTLPTGGDAAPLIVKKFYSHACIKTGSKPNLLNS